MHKLVYAYKSFHFYFKEVPIRFYRLINHLSIVLFRRVIGVNYKELIFWGPELFFYVFDLFAGPEIYNLFSVVFSCRVRNLNSVEMRIVQSVYENSILLDLVKLDENAWIGPKQFQFAYVSFFTINSFGKIPDYLLIHELMHVWQFQHYGSIYILNAWIAQGSKVNYNYGGLENLNRIIDQGGGIQDLNAEQQGEVVADYYLLRSGRKPKWSSYNPQQLPVFTYFIEKLKS